MPLAKLLQQKHVHSLKVLFIRQGIGVSVSVQDQRSYNIWALVEIAYRLQITFNSENIRFTQIVCVWSGYQYIFRRVSKSQLDYSLRCRGSFPAASLVTVS